MRLELPRKIHTIAKDIEQAGGRLYVVGGAVRDALLGLPLKDFDCEAFGVDAEALEALLARHGRVNSVGRTFGVFKLTHRGTEIDISLPRRDSKVGPGHKGIAVEGDPTMSVHEAARRRDLTVNAMMWDVCGQTLIDPVEGRADLDRRLLRAVDNHSFLEDPLRVLRVAQFAARFSFDIEPTLEHLCASAQLDELPPERIQGEWYKLLLRGVCPSRGLAFLRRTTLANRLFPERVDDLRLDEAIDRFARARSSSTPEGHQLAVGLTAWLAKTSVDGADATMTRLAVHTHHGFPVRERVLSVLAERDTIPSDPPSIRRLATRTVLRAWLDVHDALAIHPEQTRRSWRATTESLGVLDTAPTPLLQGRDLLALGIAPGPRVGLILREIYDRQLDGDITDRETAVALAHDLCQREST